MIINNLTTMPYLRTNAELFEKIMQKLMPVDNLTEIYRYEEYHSIIPTAFRNLEHLLFNDDMEYIEEYILLIKYRESADVSELPLPKDIRNIIAPMAVKTYYLIYTNFLKSNIYMRYLCQEFDKKFDNEDIEDLFGNKDFIKYNNMLYLTKLLHFIEYYDDIDKLQQKYKINGIFIEGEYGYTYAKLLNDFLKA